MTCISASSRSLGVSHGEFLGPHMPSFSIQIYLLLPFDYDWSPKAENSPPSLPEMPCRRVENLQGGLSHSPCASPAPARRTIHQRTRTCIIDKTGRSPLLHSYKVETRAALNKEGHAGSRPIIQYLFFSPYRFTYSVQLFEVNSTSVTGRPIRRG